MTDGRICTYTSVTEWSSIATTAMGAAFTSLIERDNAGQLVKSYSFTQAFSNASAGTNWDLSSGSNPNGTLQWVQFSTAIPVSPSTLDVFYVDVIWLSTEVVGQTDLADAPVSPRSISAFIKVRGYRYDSPDNSLSVRVLCAHQSTSFSETRDVISVGNGLSQLFLWLDPEAQILSNPDNWVGTTSNVTSTGWQSSPGLRTAVLHSTVGDMLSTKFGVDWDVRVTDISIFPDGTGDFIYSFILGSGDAFQPPTAPISNPSEEPHSASTTPSIAPSLLLSSCIIMLISILMLSER